jgi:RNA polymerase sigma-70 factor (ECF subfamily)
VAESLVTQQLRHDDATLVDAIRHRDEAAFAELVRRYQGPLLRLALLYTRSRASAEDIVQDAWLGVLQGIDRFESRSSFKTWLFRILVNRARTRVQRDRRMVSLSADGDESAGASVPADRFLGSDHPEWPHHWAVPPKSWVGSPEGQLLSRETLELVERAIAVLPPTQREVITLRDVQGWTPEEVCNVLQITETNQRVLLHRARSRVRAALEHHLDRERDT